MTKITLYPIDDNVTGSDKWIGTDITGNNFTKNFTPDKLAGYFNTSEVIHQPNSFRFFYDTIEVGDSRLDGSISFETEVGASVNLSALSSFMLSKKTMSLDSVSKFLEIMVNSRIIIQKAKNKGVFGVYTVDSIAEHATETDFYNVTVSYLVGEGTLDEDNDYLITLVDYDVIESSEDKNYVHSQASASTVWSVIHNLDKLPSVTVVDSAGTAVVGSVSFTDKNNLTITFTNAFSGKAYIN